MLLRSTATLCIIWARPRQLRKTLLRRPVGSVFHLSTQASGKSTDQPFQSISDTQYEDVIKQLRAEVNQLKQQIEDSKTRSREKMTQRRRKLGLGIAILVIIDVLLILVWFFYDDEKKAIALPAPASEGAEVPPTAVSGALLASPPPVFSLFKAPVKIPKAWSGSWTDGIQTIELSPSGKGKIREDGPDYVISLAEGSVTSLSSPWMSLELTQKRQFKIDKEPSCDPETGKCTMVLNGRTYSQIAQAAAK